MAEPARDTMKPTGPRVLTSVPPVRPRPAGGMGGRIFGGKIPRREQFRTHFGRSLDLGRIDSAIRAANDGRMVEITDMGRETISLDGHVSAVLNKRLNRIAALPFEVEAATGSEVDDERAGAYADIVREQLDAIPRFKQRLKDLAWAFFDGRAALEIEWQFVGGRVPWRIVNLHWIHPRRLSFGPDRELRIIDTFRQLGNFRPDGFEMRAMPYKFLEFMPRMFCDYPEREGLNRRLLYFSFFGRVGTRERLILMELHGKPWRVVTQTGETINDEGLDDAFDSAEALGATSTARMPKGFEMDVRNPPNDSGQIHANVIDHANAIESKLVLGSTGTTDAVSTGLGSSIGDAHLSEEDMVIASDGDTIAEAVEDHLTDAIIAVNFGEAELINAPRFVIDTEDFERLKELERIGKAVELGMDIRVDEAYKRTGFARPDKTDAVLKRVQREGEFGLPAPPPAIEIAYPIGDAPPPREVAIPPAEGLGIGAPDEPPMPDEGAPGEPPGVIEPESPAVAAEGASLNGAQVTAVLTIIAQVSEGAITHEQGVAIMVAAFPISEVTAGGMLGDPSQVAVPPPVAGVAPAPAAAAAAPEEDAETLSLQEARGLAEKMTELEVRKCEHGRSNRCPLCRIERVRDVQLGEDGEPMWGVVWRAIDEPAQLNANRTLPFAGFETFEACVVSMVGDGKTEEEARQICGALQAEFETSAHQPEEDERSSEGMGGTHQHRIEGSAALNRDGAHAHAFMIDGAIVLTELDGAHTHDDVMTPSGEHPHIVVMPDGTEIETGAGVSTHAHEIGADDPTVTLLDGAHVHTLEMPDGTVIESMTIEQFEESELPLTRHRRKRKPYQ